MKVSKSAAVWLVKENEQILGPYTKEEVEERLRTKDFTLEAWVSIPEGVWIPIRNQKEFIGALKALYPKEKFKAVNPKVLRILRDRGIKQKQERKKRREAQLKKEASSNLPAYLLGGVIILVLAYFGYKRIDIKPKAPEVKKSYKILAQQELENGNYTKALENFKNAHSENAEDESAYLPYAILLIQLEKDTSEAKTLLEQALSVSGVKRRLVQNGLGVAYFYENNLSEAEKAFKKAQSLDSRDPLAKINLGRLYLKNKNYRQAKTSFQDAARLGVRDGSVFLSLAEAYIQLWRETTQTKYLTQAKNLLVEYLDEYNELKPELSLAVMYLDFLGGEKNFSEKDFSSIWDKEIFEKDLYLKDLYLLPNKTEWARLNQWCDQMVESLSTTSWSSALSGYCLLKSDRVKEAKGQIEKALLGLPRAPAVYGLYAEVLLRLGDEGGASKALAQAENLDRSKTLQLPIYLKAKICEKKRNPNCAIQSWKSIVQKNSKFSMAYAKLAEAYAAKNNLSEARLFMNLGLSSAENFKPLLELKSRIAE